MVRERWPKDRMSSGAIQRVSLDASGGELNDGAFQPVVSPDGTMVVFRSFATDARARAGAQVAIDHGWDMAIPEPQRVFFYMPFEHSEDMADQDRSIDLMTGKLPEHGAEFGLHARAHAEVIRRYGRFPFRNAALGRQSTPEEAAFLEQGGYGAIVEKLKQAD